MKLKKGVRIYAVSTQGIITMLLLAGLGYFIGYKIAPDTPWAPILAVVGLLFGLVIFITYILKLEKRDKEDESKG